MSAHALLAPKAVTVSIQVGLTKQNCVKKDIIAQNIPLLPDKYNVRLAVTLPKEVPNQRVVLKEHFQTIPVYGRNPSVLIALLVTSVALRE